MECVRKTARTCSARTVYAQVALFCHFPNGGEGWIRTSVRLRGQIYSLLPLTTRPPLQGAGKARHVAARLRCVNALQLRECRSPLRLLRSLGALHFEPAPGQVTKLERVKGIEPSS